jgi:uncharacterized membrane protein
MTGKRIFLILFWIAVLIISALFYSDDAIGYFFGYRNPRFGDTFFFNQVWFVVHIAGATCSLFLGPIQFWKSIRTKFPRFHRIAGKIYIIGTLVAAVSAFRLALIFDCTACRYSLIPLSVLLFLTTSLAWYAIKNRKIEAHRQFMVRSYACALAFVFVRLDRIIPMDFIFDPIADNEIIGIVNEWTFSILPLLVVEIFLVWIPSLSAKRVSTQ